MINYFEITKYALSYSDIINVFIRLSVAFIAGTIIGLDRGMKRRGAGIKTHVLVCTSAALVMMTGEFIFHCYGTGDVARLGAQVISGVGFLGVGTIMVTGRNQIKGLTTAATLWTSACIGIAIGIGFLWGAYVLELLVMINLTVMSKIDSFILNHSKILDIYIEFNNIKAMSIFVSVMREKKIDFHFAEMNKIRIKGEGVAAVATIKLATRTQYDSVMEIIGNVEGVNFYEKM